MRKIGLLSIPLFLSVSALAQSAGKNDHGAQVSSTAQTTTIIETKGSTVSTVASANAQGSIKSKESAREARKAKRAERREALAELRASQKEAKRELRSEAGITADAGAGKLLDVRSETKSGVKADLVDAKEALVDTKAELKASRREIRKAAQKERSVTLPASGKIKASPGANVQLRRPKIKGNLNTGVALGL